jgi:transposase-like protein
VAERRRKFSPEFRDEAIKMVTKGNRSTASVARELGINAGTLGNWVAQHVKRTRSTRSLSVSERARLRELERENRELKMRNEFGTARPAPRVGDRRRPPRRTASRHAERGPAQHFAPPASSWHRRALSPGER